MLHNQPQSGPLQIDPSNPIGKGLVLECRADHRMFDVVKAIYPSASVGSVGKTSGIPGVGTSFASSVLSFGDRELFSGARATFQIIEQPNNLTQAAGIVNKRASSTSNNSFSLGYNFNSGDEFTVDIGNATGTGVGVNYQFPRTTFSTTTPNNLVIIIDGQAADGAKIQLYRNGVRITHDAIGSDTAFNTFTNTSAALELGRVNNTTNYYSGKVFLIRAWDRALGVNEVQQITTNPWQVFIDDDEEDEILTYALSTSDFASADGSSIGTSSVTAGAEAVSQAYGTSISLASLSGDTQAIFSSTGSSSGVGTGTATSVSIHQTSAEASGLSSAAGSTVSISTSTGNSISLSTVDGVTNVISTSDGVSSGIASASGVVNFIWQVDGASGSISTVSGVGADAAGGEVSAGGSSTGTSIAAATAQAFSQAVAAASGTSTASGVGVIIAASAGFSGGVSSTGAVVNSLFSSDGASAGISNTQSVVAVIIQAEGFSVGSSLIDAVTSAIKEAAGASSGVSTVSGQTQGGIHYTAIGDKFNITIVFSPYKVKVAHPYNVENTTSIYKLNKLL